ncbi:MAG: hypothetical protein J5I50_11450 [Chitinophagaceae bacterium]|nr:hypothetical protein [Chitinophagaceae bacterium]
MKRREPLFLLVLFLTCCLQQCLFVYAFNRLVFFSAVVCRREESVIPRLFRDQGWSRYYRQHALSDKPGISPIVIARKPERLTKPVCLNGNQAGNLDVFGCNPFMSG